MSNKNSETEIIKVIFVYSKCKHFFLSLMDTKQYTVVHPLNFYLQDKISIISIFKDIK